MPVRKVIYADDGRLRQKADKIQQFTPELKQLAEDMLETMRLYQGVGLAGPQLGVMQRIFVAELPPPEDDETPDPQSGVSYILINPEIVAASQELIEGVEGCLSIPTWYGQVERPLWVELTAQDINGRQLRLRAENFLARIFMHELDHLNGVLFIDYIKDPDKLWQILPEDEAAEEESARENE